MAQGDEGRAEAGQDVGEHHAEAYGGGGFFAVNFIKP